MVRQGAGFVLGGAVSAFKYIHGEKVNLNLDLQGSNTINTTSNITYGVRLSSCNVTMQGEGQNNAGNANNTKNVNNAGTGASPKTGEGQSLVLWLALAYLSSCVLAGLAITGKQKRRAKK